MTDLTARFGNNWGMMGNTWDGTVTNGNTGWGMMGNYGPWAFGLHYVLGIITWFLFIVVLVALARWLWKKSK